MLTKIDFKGKPTSREIAAFGGMLLMILIGFLQSLWQSQMITLKQLRGDLIILQPQVEATKKLIQTIDQQAQEKRQGEAEKLVTTDRLQRMLSYKATDRTQETTSLVSLLSDRHITHGVTMKGITVGDTRQQKSYSVIPLEMKLEGRYSALQRYLAELEHLDRPLLVSSINLTASNEESGFLMANFTVELYLPE